MVERVFTFTGALNARWCKIFNIIALYAAKSYKWYSLRYDFWLFRPHRTKMRLLLPMYTWSVGLSVTIVSPAKTAEPIEMPFGLWIPVGLRNHVLDGCSDPNAKGQFWRETLDIEKFRDGTSTVASVVSLSVYHTERPPLFTTPWAWRRASRRSVCGSWECMHRPVVTVEH